MWSPTTENRFDHIQGRNSISETSEIRAKVSQSGWTLVELLIVLTIVIVLAAVTLPEFGRSLLPAQRQLMQTEMLLIAQQLEEKYNETLSYQMIELKPFPADDPYYRLELVISDKGQNFVLQAIPLAKQTQDGYLYLDASGSRRLYPDGMVGAYVSW